MIDKQKTSENVYFLNTVTTDDLLPLAEQGKEPPKEVTPEPEPKPTEPVEEVPEPEPEKKDTIVTAPVAKNALHLAGHIFNGQTEVLQKFLAHNGQLAEMLFVAGSFS